MNSKPILFTSLWAASLGATFFIGKGLQPNAEGGNSPLTTKSTASSSVSSGQKISNGSTGSRANTSSARQRLDAAPMIRKGSTAPQMVIDITRSGDAIERNQALLALVDSLDPSEFASVVDSFRGLGMTRERQGEYEILLTAWAKVDPSGALAYASENTNTPLARNTILSTWATTNPEGAIAWAEANHENPDQANPWLVGIIKGIAPSDIGRATSLMETLPRSNERGEALRTLVNQLVSSDTTAAQDWVETIQDEGLRSGAYAYAAEAISDQNPSEAAQWLASLGDVDALNRVGEDIVRDWYRESPEEAKDWVSTLPPEAMSEAAEGVIGNIVREDPVEAAEWLAQLSTSNPDANFDSSIQDLVRGSARQDPLLAATWIGGLSNNNDQTRYYNRLLGDWRNRDSTAAADWVNQNQGDLPESVLRRFNQQSEGGR